MVSFRLLYTEFDPRFLFLKGAVRTFLPKIINLSPFLLVFFFIAPALGAPGGKVTIEGEAFEPQRTFSLRIEMYWEGEEERYEIRSHRLELPEGIEEKGVSLSALGGADGHKVVYVVHLAGQKEGAYTIDPIEVDYREKGKEEVFTKRLPGVSFKVVKKPVFGTGSQWVLLGGGFVVFLGLFFGIYAWQSRRMKNSDRVLTSSAQEIREQFLSRLEECRKFKTEGDLARFFHTALLLHKEIASFNANGDEKKEVTEMEELAERVKYGGVKPGSEVVDKYFRNLERLVKNF